MVGEEGKEKVKEIGAVGNPYKVPSRASSCSQVRGRQKLEKKVEAPKVLRVGTRSS